MDEIRKGDELDLYVEKIAFGGKAIARYGNFIIFIEHAIPGQQVRVRITKRKRHYADAYVLQVIQQSSVHEDPFCPHFGTCGGCSWQEIPYDEQLRWKRLQVLECLEHVAGVREAIVEPAISSPQSKWYRNKMEFTFSDRRWLSRTEVSSREVQFDRNFALGLHVRGFFDRVFNVDHCFLESPAAVGILKEIREWCRNSGVEAYNTREHRGYWRFLVIREGKRTGEMLVHIITADHKANEEIVVSLANYLRSIFPEITTFVHSVSRKKAQVAIGDSSRILFGPGHISENLGGLRFQVSSHSFFQTNTNGANRLYDTILKFGDFNGTETVWDLYCGTGSISLYVAPRVKRVTGFEIVQEAIDDAYVNRELNGIDNCDFRSGDLKNEIKEAFCSNACETPDVVITDPPRAGMHPDVTRTLLEIAPGRIIAVSCNPATLARDLAQLLERYEIKEVQPCDLFPHTPHIECVVNLVRRH